MDSAKAKAQMSAPYLETQVPFVIQKEKVENRLKIDHKVIVIENTERGLKWLS